MTVVEAAGALPPTRPARLLDAEVASPLRNVQGRSEGVRRLRLFAQGRTQKPLLKSPVPMNIASPESMTGAGAVVIVPASGTATVVPRLSGRCHFA
jgi:hypothetical protein